MRKIGWLVANFGLLLLKEAQSCNEGMCGSIISKCFLTKKCMCESSNIKCRNQCLECLSSLTEECCSCVNMCPHTRSIESHVGKLRPIPKLFNILNQHPEKEMRWNSISYPIKITHHGKNKKTNKPKQDLPLMKLLSNGGSVNCTVAFISKSTQWAKCQSICQTMGSNGYRWFENGCCECVGEYCLHYGIKEDKCEYSRLNTVKTQIKPMTPTAVLDDK